MGLWRVPIGLVFEHQFAGGGLEPVDGGLCEEGSAMGRQPLVQRRTPFDERRQRILEKATRAQPLGFVLGVLL
jgi:hypothetical protein